MISYCGPVVLRAPIRSELGLTADKRIFLAPERVRVSYPYTDAPEEVVDVLADAYEVLFGEKVSALTESTRRPDLYDVVNLFRNGEALISLSVLLNRHACIMRSSSRSKAKLQAAAER
jgi:predicted nucleotidyltransferase component of viral defense system